LIRVQHHHLTGSAHMDRAPVAEDLDARVGHTDGIGVVAMFPIGLAGEPCAEELDATDRPRSGDPALDGTPARSFKTFAGRCGFVETHRSLPTHGGSVRLASRSWRLFCSRSWPPSRPAPATSC